MTQLWFYSTLSSPSLRTHGVTVDKSVHKEDGSDNEEKDEDIKNIVCQLLDQRMASQRRDKSYAPSH